MKETNNLKLKKPAQSDFYNIDDFNYNSDVIDEAIEKIHKQVDGINPDAGSITYDNKMSGLKSINVKDAIDEINCKSEANKTSTLEVEKIANSAKQRGDEVKQILVDKLISEGVNASTGEGFESLIGKIELEKHKKMPQWFKTNDFWVSGSNMPTARYYFGSTVIGNNIYCVGGSTTNINECYDTTTNTWTTKKPSTYSRFGGTAQSLGNNIYVIGGNLTMIECYDAITDTWTIKKTSFLKREYLTSAIVGSNIYCIGGSDAVPYSRNECYDTITDTLTTKRNMITSRNRLTADVINGKIYCVGGRGNSSTDIFGINECYDVASDSWEAKSPMPTKRHGHASCVIGNYIYCIGGDSSNANERYNVTTNSWEVKSPISTYRYGLSASSVDGIAYVIGGYIPQKEVGINDVYIP